MNQDTKSSRGISPELAEKLIRAVRAEQAANDGVDEQVTEFLGINRTDGRCIDIIDRHGRMTAGALATESGLTTGAVTALVDRLEAAGYLHRVRDTVDRRKIFIELTPLMKTITERLFYNMEGMYQGMLERLTEQDVAAIIYFLEAGTFINGHRVRMLKEHVPRKDASREARLAAATAYDKDARRLTPQIDRMIREQEFPKTSE